MLSFNFDVSKGESPASVAQKRALIAQLMGTPRSPSNLGEGFSALGDGIVANVEGGRARDAESKGQESANSTFSALTGMLTGQGGQTWPRTASDATASMAGGGDFMSGLINSESGGNWGALNDEGYGGRLQFGDARLADAAAAGVIPPGATGAAFSRMSPEQQQAVEQWHFADIDRQAADMGLDRYFGQTIAGVPITPESVKAMAHLGGIGGVQKFITSGGQYNPADSNGTRLSDYGSRFGGTAQPAAPVQVASLDQSIGMPAAPQQAQLPPIAPSQPQQVAQAAPMAPQAPAAAAPAPVQTAQGPSLQMLMEAAANPWLNESQKAIINTMISEQMRQQDPAYQMGLEKSQIELEALRNPQKKPIEVGGVLLDADTMEPIFDSRAPADNGFTLSPGQQRFDAQGNPIAAAQAEPGFRLLTPDEIAATPNLDPNKAWQIGPDNKVYEIGGGGVNVSVGGASPTPGDDKFYETLGAESGKRYSSMIAQGSTARRNLSQLDVASDLLATAPQGPMGVATLMAGKFGIDLGGLNETQALNSVIEQMVPAQREPGSGPMSDKDIEMYRGSVVSLSNMPGGNKLIIDTARAINQYDVQIAEIAGKVEDGLITRAQAREEMASVPNPIDAFREARKAIQGGNAGPASTAPAPNQSQAPRFNSQADFDAAPSGTVFTAPDGSIRVKP